MQDWNQLLANMVSSSDMTSSFCRAISQTSVDVGSAFHARVRLELVDSTELVYMSQFDLHFFCSRRRCSGSLW